MFHQQTVPWTPRLSNYSSCIYIHSVLPPHPQPSLTSPSQPRSARYLGCHHFILHLRGGRGGTHPIVEIGLTPEIPLSCSWSIKKKRKSYSLSNNKCDNLLRTFYFQNFFEDVLELGTNFWKIHSTMCGWMTKSRADWIRNCAQMMDRSLAPLCKLWPLYGPQNIEKSQLHRCLQPRPYYRTISYTRFCQANIITHFSQLARPQFLSDSDPSLPSEDTENLWRKQSGADVRKREPKTHRARPSWWRISDWWCNLM